MTQWYTIVYMTREQEPAVDLSAVTREDVLAAVQNNKVNDGFRHLIEGLLEEPTTDITATIIAALVRLANESSPDLPGQGARAGAIATVRAVIAQWPGIIMRSDVISVVASEQLEIYETSEERGPTGQLEMRDLGPLVEE